MPPDIFDRIESSSSGDIFDRIEEPARRGILSRAIEGAKHAGGALVGAGEIAANLATQTYGLPARGFAEVASLFGRPDIPEKVSKALIYEPQTEQGRAGMDAIGSAFDWWHRKSMGVGTPVQEAVSKRFGTTAGEVAGTTVASTMEAAPLFLGSAYGKVKGNIAERRAMADRAAMEDIARERRSQSEADLSRANLGEVIPEDPAAAAMAREAATRKYGGDIFDRIQSGYLGEEVRPKGVRDDLAADPFVMGREMSPSDMMEKYGSDVYDRIRRGYLGDTTAEGTPRPFVAPQVQEYAGPRKPPSKMLAPTGKVEPPAPTPEGGLFPGKKKAFAFASEEAPEATEPFTPVAAEQPLLTGTEKAYRDVGMKEKVAPQDAPLYEQIDSLRSILPDFELGKKIWSQDKIKPEVIGNTPNMYPPWFKEVFKNDSAKDVMATIDKWKEKGDSSLSKKENRIMASVQDLAQDAVKRGEDIGESHWRSMLNERGTSPEVSHAARQMKEFFVPLSTMPMGEAYKALRYKDLLGGLTRVDRIVGQLSNRFKGLSITDKADVFNAIRGEIPFSTLPEELQTIAKQTRADLDRTGQMLVRRGMLKQEVFDANKDNYIHYLYLRHILPDEANIPVGRGGRMDLSYLIKRKDLTESMRKELGLIEDVSIAAPVGMGKALGDTVKADFFRKVAANPGWVWQPSMEIAKLNRELKAYKQIVERGENVGPDVVARYQQLQAELSARSAEAGKAPADFIQLPDSKAYGDLQGAYVRKEIANDIVPVYSVNIGELEGLGRIWNKAGKAFDMGMTMFKVGKVALNPPTMIRNTFSNFIQMNMSGIPLYRIPNVVVDGVQSMIAKDKYYRMMERHGGFKTNFSVAELGEVLKTFQDAKGGPVTKFFGGVTNAAKYYGRIDDIAKMSLFKDAVTRQGMSVADAVMYAQKWGMDYSLASRSVKHARRYVLPFASYQYKIAPLVAETLVKRPWVLAKYAAIPYLMAKAAADRYDWTDKDIDKAQKMMLEKTKGQGAYMLLPIKDNKGNIEVVNMEYFLPWGNLLEMARDVKGGEYLDVAKKFGGVAGPYGNIAAMITTKREGEPPKDPFTGQPVYSKLDSPQTKYLKQAEWWWKLFGPTSFSSTGALGYSYKAATGEKDKWGVEATGMKALGRWMGVNVGSIDPQSIMASRKARVRQLQAEMLRIQRDPQYSPKERRDALKRLQAEHKKIVSPE